MATYRSYDALFNEILTSYRNASGVESTTVGDELYIRASGLASAIWGLHKEVQWVENQIFEDSASQANIEHHAATYSLYLLPGESYEELLARLKARKRQPAAGGNRYDFVRWTLECSSNSERVDRAVCVPNGYGIGTCLMFVYNSDGSKPSDALLAYIYNVLMDKAPVAPREIYVQRPIDKPVDISIRMTGGNKTDSAAQIRSYIDSLTPAKTLVLSFLAVFCIQSGADDVEILTPTANVVPGPFEKITIGSLEFV